MFCKWMSFLLTVSIAWAVGCGDQPEVRKSGSKLSPYEVASNHCAQPFGGNPTSAAEFHRYHECLDAVNPPVSHMKQKAAVIAARLEAIETRVCGGEDLNPRAFDRNREHYFRGYHRYSQIENRLNRLNGLPVVPTPERTLTC